MILTDAQLVMLQQSGPDQYGVEIRGAGGWAVARALAEADLGHIEGDPGCEPPALFFANDDGVEYLRCDEDGELEDFECPTCGSREWRW